MINLDATAAEGTVVLRYSGNLRLTQKMLGDIARAVESGFGVELYRVSMDAETFKAYNSGYKEQIVFPFVSYQGNPEND